MTISCFSGKHDVDVVPLHLEHTRQRQVAPFRALDVLPLEDSTGSNTHSH